MRRIAVLLGFAALIALSSDQALVGAAGGLQSGDRWQTRLRLFASEPVPHREPRRQGALKVEIPSFGYVGRNGDVFLPTRTLRIAVPEGRGEIRISGIRGEPSPIKGLKLEPPAPASGRLGTQALPRATALTKREARRGAARTAPATPAEFAPSADPIRLGDVGYFRDQKFVEIIYTPVVSPKGGGEALFFGQMDVDLVVDGIDPQAISDDPAARDPLFEDQYRMALVNYDEGRYFRVKAATAPPRASTRTSAAAVPSISAIHPSAGISSTFPSFKLTVTKDGIYRLSSPYLLDPNTGVAKTLAGADPRQFKIMNRGVEIPIFVQGEGDGSFDAADFVEFYGQKLDGPETILNFNLGQSPSIYQYDDYGDKNVYWLSVDPNGARSRMAPLNAPPNGAFPLATDFEETIHSEIDNLYQPTGGEDPFLMTPRLNSNSGSVVADANTCVYTNPGIPTGPNFLDPNSSDPNHACPVCNVSVPGVNTASMTPASVSVRMRGSTEEPTAVPDHLTVVELNGVPSRSTAACWSGLNFFTQSVSLPQSVLGSTLKIKLEEPGLAATVGNEQLLVDFTEVTYRRLFQAVTDNLRFTIPNDDHRVAVSGLSSNIAGGVELLEITDTLVPVDALGGPAIAAPTRVTGGTFSGSAGNFTLTFTNAQDPNQPGSRTYHLAGPAAGGFLLPDSVAQDVPSTLLDPNNEADVLVIGDPNVMDQSGGSAFTAYWNHRAAVDGYVIKVVSILDVYDDFGWGISHPQAIKNFLEYTYTNWKGPSLDPNRPPPAFATLIGDTTADPKNNLNRGDWINHVPTFMMFQFSAVLGFYASDAFIAAFHGNDQVPDIHLGRIPVRTPAEATTVFQKLLAYETVVPPGNWLGHGTFVADEGKVPGESSEFMRITDEVADGFWNPKPPFSVTKLYFDTATYDFGNSHNGNFDTQFLNDILASQNAGASLMTYTGHGAFSIWGVDGWFFTTDVASLSANNIYSFIINENCLSGGFHALGGEALSETFLKAPNKGAAAFFAPAGLSFSFIGEAINSQVYGDIFGPMKMRRFGPLITNVRLLLGSVSSVIDEQSYMLVGDPTSLFAVPAPNPPRSLVAVAGNAQVNLSWTASVDPNTKTFVYRSTNPAGPYARLTSSAITGTSYHDPNVVNAAVYYYQTSSVDPNGFEGRASNFNSDCVTSNLPASGPDCVWVKPVNPSPPITPLGAYVFSDGSGSRLTVVWTANPENDLANYVIRYGTQHGGPYTQTLFVGISATSQQITGLVNGTTYFLTLSAKNTSASESAPTAEMVGKPTVFAGENPPALITNLTIAPTVGDPNSLTLSWTKPTSDIYGNPTTVTSFSIYRGLIPTFPLDSTSRIVTITNPNAGSYNDVGARVAPPDYYYLMTSTDVRGFTSGGGNELPKGISDLTASLSGPTTLHFQWNAITQDVKGAPTIVSKYMLYASDTPIPRSRIDSLSPTVDNIFTTSANVPLNSINKYYSVIVVDLRGNKSPL